MAMRLWQHIRLQSLPHPSPKPNRNAHPATNCAAARTRPLMYNIPLAQLPRTSLHAPLPCNDRLVYTDNPQQGACNRCSTCPKCSCTLCCARPAPPRWQQWRRRLLAGRPPGSRACAGHSQQRAPPVSLVAAWGRPGAVPGRLCAKTLNPKPIAWWQPWVGKALWCLGGSAPEP